MARHSDLSSHCNSHSDLYIVVGMLGFNLDVGHYIFGIDTVGTIFGFALTIFSFQLAIKGLDEYRGKQANKQSPL